MQGCTTNSPDSLQRHKTLTEWTLQAFKAGFMPGAKHTNLRAVCKRAPFRGQKHTFYTLKGYQTERKSITFEKRISMKTCVIIK